MLGDMVRDRREELTIKGCKLASLVGVSTSYVTQIEKNSVIPSPAVVYKIADALSIHAMDLVHAAKEDKFAWAKEQIEKEYRRARMTYLASK